MWQFTIWNRRQKSVFCVLKTKVSAEDKASGKVQQITITSEKGRLSDEDIERMVKEAEQFVEQDRQDRYGHVVDIFQSLQHPFFFVSYHVALSQYIILLLIVLSADSAGNCLVVRVGRYSRLGTKRCQRVVGAQNSFSVPGAMWGSSRCRFHPWDYNVKGARDVQPNRHGLGCTVSTFFAATRSYRAPMNASQLMTELWNALHWHVVDLLGVFVFY